MTNPTNHDERTGRVDAVLYGRVLELLDEAQRTLTASVSRSRIEFARADARVDAIAAVCEILSGTPAVELRAQVARDMEPGRRTL